MELPVRESKKTASLSLIDIFKFDDIESLNNFIKTNPEISISTYIPFSGNNLPVGAVAAAMHYRAINCLKLLLSRHQLTFETYGGKMGGPSAAHVACENQWEPGLQILIEAKVPLNTFDGNSKTPLAYVADHENISFFRHFLKYFEDTNQVKNGLKNVALESEGSLDFLSYCVENKKIIMIEACNYATKKGFIEKHEIKNAILRWKSKYSDDELPLFLRCFDDTFTLQDKCAINNLFSPLVPSSKFAEINSPYSIPIYDVILKINQLCELSNIKVYNIREKNFNFKKFSNFIFNIEKEKVLTTHFSTYKMLKKYFNSFFKLMKRDEKSKYYLPFTNQHIYIRECWRDFGTVLAHVAYTGFHYHFKYPLHPLIYHVLTIDNPKNIKNLDPEDIEEYFQVIKPNKIRGGSIIEARKKGLEHFLKGEEFQNQYDDSLRSSWKTEVRGFDIVLTNIYNGFYKENSDSKFMEFLEEIKKLDVTTMRIWFEGIYYKNPIQNRSQFDLFSQLNFKLYMRENDGGVIRAKKFIQMFKEWMKECNTEILINFFTALLGNKVLWPVESNYKTIFIISKPIDNMLNADWPGNQPNETDDSVPAETPENQSIETADNQSNEQSEMQSDDENDELPEHLINEPIPYVIVPTQEAAIPILNSIDEINDLVNRALTYGQIGYVTKEQILKGLILINLEVVM